MKPKFRIGLLGYCILGIAVLVLMVFEIMDGNGPMIGLDAVLPVSYTHLFKLFVKAARPRASQVPTVAGFLCRSSAISLML